MVFKVKDHESALRRSEVGHTDLVESHGLIQNKSLFRIKGRNGIHNHIGMIKEEFLRSLDQQESFLIYPIDPGLHE